MSEPTPPPSEQDASGEEELARPASRGISLRELMLVVALIALLAAMFTPIYQRARMREQISRVQSDMRILAIALESYSVDDMSGPGCALAEGPPRTRRDGHVVPMPNSVHFGLPRGSGARRTITFLSPNPAYSGISPHCLTTPVSYIRGFPPDPFADTEGATYGFYNSTFNGWILWSPGPDRDENAADGPGDIGPRVEHIYDMSHPGPNTSFADLAPHLYDPTNGLRSNGDLARENRLQVSW
jgi:type II secretory pathway pseudopilin PulG